MKGKRLGISFLVFVLTFLTAACSSKSADQPIKEDGKIVVNFWHSMGGHNLGVLENLVNKYNESQDKVVVKPVYQGNYREGFSKISSVIGTDQTPAIMQLNEYSTRPMIDSGYIKPMQEFIDKDNFDISTFEPLVLGRYQVDGKLYSMPFNPSLAVVYYNKEAFKEAGLDPENPPQTYSEFAEAAEKLTIREGGETKRYGISIVNFNWHFEQLVVNQGGYLVNNENGRKAPPTEGTINSEEMQRAISWIKDMYDKGIYGNYGRSLDDARDAFYAGKVAMIVDTSSNTVPMTNNAPFEVGIAKYPVPDGIEPHGSVIGGASLWIFKDIPKETQEAAWDFVKYLLKPETQAYWTTNTGYFPVTREVYETKEYKDFLKKYPHFQSALDQLHIGKVEHANQGAYIGVYFDLSVILEDQFEKILNGTVDVKTGLNQANEAFTKALQRYEKTQGQ